MSVLSETQKDILTLIDKAEKIFESTATWEMKYDLIFGMRIAQKIRESDLSFDWYDPDTSYEEDVRYYMRALREFREGFGDLWRSEDDDEN